jgi:hypothetical protein
MIPTLWRRRSTLLLTVGPVSLAAWALHELCALLTADLIVDGVPLPGTPPLLLLLIWVPAWFLAFAAAIVAAGASLRGAPMSPRRAIGWVVRRGGTALVWFALVVAVSVTCLVLIGFAPLFRFAVAAAAAVIGMLLAGCLLARSLLAFAATVLERPGKPWHRAAQAIEGRSIELTALFAFSTLIFALLSLSLPQLSGSLSPQSRVGDAVVATLWSLGMPLVLVLLAIAQGACAAGAILRPGSDPASLTRIDAVLAGLAPPARRPRLRWRARRLCWCRSPPCRC